MLIHLKLFIVHRVAIHTQQDDTSAEILIEKQKKMLLGLKNMVHHIEKAENQSDVLTHTEIVVESKKNLKNQVRSDDTPVIQSNQANTAEKSRNNTINNLSVQSEHTALNPTVENMGNEHDEEPVGRVKRMQESLEKLKRKQPKRQTKIDLFEAFPDSDDEIEREEDARKAFDNMLSDVSEI